MRKSKQTASHATLYMFDNMQSRLQDMIRYDRRV